MKYCDFCIFSLTISLCSTVNNFGFCGDSWSVLEEISWFNFFLHTFDAFTGIVVFFEIFVKRPVEAFLLAQVDQILSKQLCVDHFIIDCMVARSSWSNQSNFGPCGQKVIISKKELTWLFLENFLNNILLQNFYKWNTMWGKMSIYFSPGGIIFIKNAKVSLFSYILNM